MELHEAAAECGRCTSACAVFPYSSASASSAALSSELKSAVPAAAAGAAAWWENAMLEAGSARRIGTAPSSACTIPSQAARNTGSLARIASEREHCTHNESTREQKEQQQVREDSECGAGREWSCCC